MAQLTPEELAQVNSLNSRYANIFIEIGQMEVKMSEHRKLLIDLEEDKEILREDYLRISKEETAIVKSLNEKYGEGSLDLTTGIITP